MVVNQLRAFAESARDNGQWRRRDVVSHLQCQRGRDRMHAAADAACPAGDMDRVERVALFQDQFVPAKERGLGASVKHAPSLQVNRRVKGERPGHTCYRVNVEFARAHVADDLFQRVFGVAPGGAARTWRRAGRRAEWVAFSVFAQIGVSVSVELNRQIFETHRSLKASFRLNKAVNYSGVIRMTWAQGIDEPLISHST